MESKQNNIFQKNEMFRLRCIALCLLLMISSYITNATKSKVKIKIIESTSTSSSSSTSSNDHHQDSASSSTTTPLHHSAATPQPFPLKLQEIFAPGEIFNHNLGSFKTFLNVRQKVEVEQVHRTNLGVFSRFEEDDFTLIYDHGDFCQGEHQQSYSAQVELKCSDVEMFNMTNTRDCTWYFVLKSPKLCALSLSIAEANAVADEKVLEIARLMAQKYEEFGENVLALLNKAKEYEQCLKFAAGKIAKTNSKFCIDLVGRRISDQQTESQSSSQTNPIHHSEV
jgi:hypothetical protein